MTNPATTSTAADSESAVVDMEVDNDKPSAVVKKNDNNDDSSMNNSGRQQLPWVEKYRPEK